ncbi:MAG: rod shape-determining protein MreC [Mangrovibacterium sp.]
MRSLFRFLSRNYFFLLFLVLESISLVLIVNYNNFQKVQFLNSSNRVTASIYESFNSVYSFFNLRQTNAELAAENARLRNQLQTFVGEMVSLQADSIPTDSVQYEFIPARVINSSFNKQYNYITLNKGRKDGVEPDMGIIGPTGVVGIITQVSDHYATGPTILNKRWRVSAKIKSSNYFGSLAWDGLNYQKASLNEIPFHVEMTIGDTIVTSGYSSVFPEGIPIGQIDDFTYQSGDNFYDISVTLTTNFANLRHVEVIKNNHRNELNNMQQQYRNE